MRVPRAARLSVVQWFGAMIGALVLVAVAGAVLAFVSLQRLGDLRELAVDRLDPAIATVLRLDAALLNEETGVRGYALAREEGFLEPYRRGRAVEERALADLRRLLRDTALRLPAGEVRLRAAARAWRTRFAEPVIAAVRRGEDAFTPAAQARGKVLFDAVRAAGGRLQSDLTAERAVARARLERSARTATGTVLAFGGALLLAVLGSALLLRGVVVAPLRALATSVRSVARGAFDRPVEATGAREVRELATDVDAMRARILDEVHELAITTDELKRSNAELEQFAYVASHDLQEPLRKVASFCQMLQRRYGGRLDERADSYIEFAVDGAKRMQDLIDDLLAFSRVGRLSEPQVVVDCNELVVRAKSALGDVVEATGAVIEAGELPQVRGEASLLALVFQNLIANGLKFRGDAPPRIRVQAERNGRSWHFTVADNGIGIEPEYADRIFVIFQRLHPRAAYEGTGIGLAMCRKVIEYHGGRIWLDTEPGDGATFHFTLPAIVDDQETA